jgi:hypothetical protein
MIDQLKKLKTEAKTFQPTSPNYTRGITKIFKFYTKTAAKTSEPATLTVGKWLQFLRDFGVLKTFKKEDSKVMLR